MKPTAFKPRFSFPYVFPPVTVVNRSSRNIFFLLYVIHIYLRQVPVKLRQRLFPVLPFWRLELINRSPIANRELVPPFHSRRGFLSVYLTYIYRKILVFFLGRRQGKRPATASNPPPQSANRVLYIFFLVTPFTMVCVPVVTRRACGTWTCVALYPHG